MEPIFAEVRLPRARGKALEQIAMVFGYSRMPRWQWVPGWLRWPRWLWESDEMLRRRVTDGVRDWLRRGVAAGSN
jgi:hypothetical protein